MIDTSAFSRFRFAALLALVAAVPLAAAHASGPASTGDDTVFADGFDGYAIYPGFIGVDLVNATGGVWSDADVHVTVIGINPASGTFAHVAPDGAITDIAVADNDAPGHLVKNGVNYPAYGFTLAQSRLLKLPKMAGGRVFISLGEPIYLRVMPGGDGHPGYAGPNPQNPSDPNVDVHFDWYEFTWDDAGLWINTTQVDQFGLPMQLDVRGEGGAFRQRTGITESIAAIDAAFASEVPPEFHPAPIDDLRILSPTKIGFGNGGAHATYFDGYVTAIWSQYASSPLVIDLFGGTRRFSGTTTGDELVFSEVDLHNGAYVGNIYRVGRPDTEDILQCSGTMAHGDANPDVNTVQLALEAQICAAFNRHAMHDVAIWRTPSAWYAAAPANFYAAFWHRHSIDALAYGFAYDDVAEQSSTITTPAPEHMTFTIGW